MDDDSGRRITDQVARFLLMRVDRLSRIVPSDLEAEDQMCRNGEYVSLYEVQQLLTGLFAPPAPEALEDARVRAYRAARVYEPSMEGYNAAMAVYEAAFSQPSAPELMREGQLMHGEWVVVPAAAPEAAREGWQPTASAPKDGTWCVFTSVWNSHARWCARFEEGRWQDINEGENRIGHFEAFTHWMPLPSPPKEEIE